MINNMKTILSAVKQYVDGGLKKSVPDWNESNPESINYVKNRPFYESEPVEVTFVEETTFELTEERTSFFAATQPLEVGQEYIVTLDGIQYNVVCMFHNEFGIPYLGNLSVLGTGANTGEPFCILLLDSETELGMMVNSDVLEHTVSIVGNIAEIHHIDDKYIPKSIKDSIKTQWNEISNLYDQLYNNSNFMSSYNPTGSGSFSMNRKSGTTIGNYSHAEGYNGTASGDYSHAEGEVTTASGWYSHAEGRGTTASGISSHAEGTGAKASGDYSHAEGEVTTASGTGSHAEGRNTTASGRYSHAEGMYTTASGNYSHAQGVYNITDSYGVKKTRVNASFNKNISFGHEVTIAEIDYANHRFILGECSENLILPPNVKQDKYYVLHGNTINVGTDGKKYCDSVELVTSIVINNSSCDIITIKMEVTSDGCLHIVGNGMNNTSRSNAHTLDWLGNAWFAGDVYVGSASGTHIDDGSKKLATMDDFDTYEFITVADIDEICGNM